MPVAVVLVLQSFEFEQDPVKVAHNNTAREEHQLLSTAAQAASTGATSGAWPCGGVG